MKRLAKGAGYGNVYLEEVPIPPITPGQVLVRAHTSLISRGSEILRRYRLEGPVDPGMMGYSAVGTVVEVGAEARATGYVPGDRVYATAPHAEYVASAAPDPMRTFKLPAAVPWPCAPFLGFVRAGLAWAISSGARPTDTVVVLGQGLIGNMVMQAHRARGVGRVLTVDPLELRARLSRELGAAAALQAGGAAAVAEVRRLTGGRGADVVVDCVGGPPGVASFAGALEMAAPGGTVHLIGLYHGAPLPLDASRMMGKLLIGGYRLDEPLGPLRARTATLIEEGKIKVEPLITHRFPAGKAAEAFALLDGHLEQALGVLLEWPQGPEGPRGPRGAGESRTEGGRGVADVYRVACIGASRMGSWFDDTMRARAATEGGRWLEWVPGSVAAVCQAVEQTELVAVCDLDQALVEQMQARWHIPAGYADYQEMIERERPDVVAIVTSWGSTHAEIAATVAETGLVRGITCEKPIGASMAQADRVVEAAGATGWSSAVPTSDAGTPVIAWRSDGSRRGPSGRCGPSPAAPWATCCTSGRTTRTP